MVALDQHRPDDDAARPTVADAMKNVANNGARRRGDDTDRAWSERQGAFAVGGKQAFGMQFLLQSLQLSQERTDAGDFHLLDDDLVFRRRREGGDPAGDDDFQAIVGLGLQARHLAFPDDAVDRRLVVLQRQIDVTRCMARDLGYFAAQPHMVVGGLDGALQRPGQFRNGIGGGIARIGGRKKIGHGVYVRNSSGLVFSFQYGKF